MAYQFYVTIIGAKQGQFKGEGTGKSHKGKIPAVGFLYEVKSPRDIATGQASGKRQHNPVRITKEWGASSPQIFQALVTNEVLKSVLCEFVRADPKGQEEVYYTIKLTNASVSDLKQYLDETQTAGDYAGKALEDVSFTFQKIEEEDKIANRAASDSWM